MKTGWNKSRPETTCIITNNNTPAANGLSALPLHVFISFPSRFVARYQLSGHRRLRLYRFEYRPLPGSTSGGKIRILDNLLTSSIANLEPYLNLPNVEFIEGDIRDLDTCHKACKGIDLVTHQAALGSVPRSVRDPLATHAINATGFLNMLIAARDAGVKRFVYASSSSVYGDHPVLPKREDETGNPLSPYAVSKKTNELYARVFAETYGMQIMGLRYFNVFGPNQSPDGPYAAVIPLS